MPSAAITALARSGNLRLRTARRKKSRFYECYHRRNSAALITRSALVINNQNNRKNEI